MFKEGEMKKISLFILFGLFFILVSQLSYGQNFEEKIEIGGIREKLFNELEDYLNENFNYFKLSNLTLQYNNKISGFKKVNISEILNELNEYFDIKAEADNVIFRLNLYEKKYPDPKVFNSKLQNIYDDYQNLYSTQTFNNDSLENYITKLNNIKFKIDCYSNLFSKSNYNSSNKLFDKNISTIKEMYSILDSTKLDSTEIEYISQNNVNIPENPEFIETIKIGIDNQKLFKKISDYLSKNIEFFKLPNQNIQYTKRFIELKESNISEIIPELYKYVDVKIDTAFVIFSLNSSAKNYPSPKIFNSKLKNIQNDYNNLSLTDNFDKFYENLENYLVKISNIKFQIDCYSKLFSKSNYTSAKKLLNKNTSILEDVYNSLISAKIEFISTYNVKTFEKSEFSKTRLKIVPPQLKIFIDNKETILSISPYFGYKLGNSNFIIKNNEILMPQKNCRLSADNTYKFKVLLDIDKIGKYIKFQKNLSGNIKVYYDYMYDKTKTLKGIIFTTDDEKNTLRIQFSKSKYLEEKFVKKLLNTANTIYKKNLKLENITQNKIEFTLEGNKINKSLTCYYNSNNELIAADSPEASVLQVGNEYFYYDKKSTQHERYKTLLLIPKEPVFNLCSPFNYNNHQNCYVYSNNLKPVDSPITMKSIIEGKKIKYFNYNVTIYQFIFENLYEKNKDKKKSSICELQLIDKYSVPYSFIYKSLIFKAIEYIQ